jgi:hypothetical protein
MESGRERATLLSTKAWRELLSDAGLDEIQAYTVLPSTEAPLRLVNTDPDMSRIGFGKELALVRGSSSTLAYLVRRAIVRLGLNRHIEESLLIWGRRP